MPERRCNAERNTGALGHHSAPWSHVAVLALISAASTALAQQLPPGGTTSWEIQGPEEIVTFVLFDPKAPGVSLPAGLRFVSARDIQMPEVQAYLKQHSDHAEWAFSFIEITRQKAFLLDGRTPKLPENGGIGLWFAPVDPSQLAEEITKDAFDNIIAPSVGAIATVRLANGKLRRVELHWYEAHGIGKRDLKIKAYL